MERKCCVSFHQPLYYLRMNLNLILKSRGVKWIGLGWTGFIVENLVLSQYREQIIGEYGDKVYHNVYNTLSTLACGSIGYGYFKHGKGCGPALRNPRGKVAMALGFAVQTIGLVGLSQLAPKLQMPVELAGEPVSPSPSSASSLPAIPTSSSPAPTTTSPPSAAGQAAGNSKIRIRCPMDFKPKDVPEGSIFGLERVSRHATFWSFGLVCLGQALFTPLIPEIVFFTFPVVFAVIGGSHQDYRHRRGSGGYLSPERDRVTSNIPFLALVTGKQSWSELSKETKWSNAGVASLLSIVLFLKKIR